MKEILYVQPGRTEGLINFEYQGKGVPTDSGANKPVLEKILEKECSRKGVVVFIPVEEYEKYKKVADGELVVISVDRYNELLERKFPENC